MNQDLSVAKTTYYIAGPMAGIPGFNFPAFEEAAAALRGGGFDVISPAEEDVFLGFLPGSDKAASTVTPEARAGYMRRDIPIVLSVDGVVMLPGWINSIGAVVEFVTARAIGVPVFYFTNNELLPVDQINDAAYMGLAQTLRKVVV